MIFTLLFYFIFLEYIEKYLAEKKLDLTATLDAKLAYSNADFVVIAAPTNVYPKFSVEFS